MLVAIALVLVAVGTVVFHFASPWWWTEIASNWGYIDDTIIITFWIIFIPIYVCKSFMRFNIIRIKLHLSYSKPFI